MLSCLEERPRLKVSMWSVTRPGPLLGQQGPVSVAWSGPSISSFSQSPSAVEQEGSICVSQKSAGLHKGPVISWQSSSLGPSQQALGFSLPQTRLS